MSPEALGQSEIGDLGSPITYQDISDALDFSTR